MSSLLRSIDKFKDLSDEPEDKRIEDHMSAGTELRERTERGDILALLAISEVQNIRKKETGDPKKAKANKAYIFSSLKHPDEAKALRDIYGRLFILISAYLPREKRVDEVEKAISKSKNRIGTTSFRSRAEELISRDEEEEGKNLGQDVTDVFPMADLFVDSRNEKVIESNLSRFIEILFSYPFHTPTIWEFGMYMAHASGLRSADLSRQVGAVVQNSSGDIISYGCNEVPKFFGGQYWEDDENDYRDFRVGYDSSTIYKNDIFREIIDIILQKGFFNEEIAKEGSEKIAKRLLLEKGGTSIDQAQISRLLEFGRPIHAEMAAISTSARLGVSIEGCTMFSTTFPCHMCARHIIASGISEVVYIEPYPKSRVRDLYPDSVIIDAEDRIPTKVNFMPFVGVAPRRFHEFFILGNKKRKNKSGKRIDWSHENSSPIVRRLVITYIMLEERVLEFADDYLKSKGFEIL
ncbi:MAG: deoxycytidylate deaminase [Hyphomicrobiales bacterium]|nr:deoxycytidylate deaminase [Hyphomicrobiales bacterium]